MTKRIGFKMPFLTQLLKGSTELLILVAVQRQLNLQKQLLIIFDFLLRSRQEIVNYDFVSVNFFLFPQVFWRSGISSA
uniref:Uncharacterized protein n=1 Tax=Medicago truncatula TaxID=3880 RepID=I3SCM8_MEDTR|nr:unknown [Medicago truncatula]